ncbi:MAG TPA: hypothetical protein ENN61_05650, partial [Bacteroidaceae bacterium]|nr:hypothetical protein [Bacteroidaceae bacterium]
STTGEGGLITLNIGEGSQLSGSFSGIDWGESDHFVKIEMDPEPEKTSGYVHMGTSQLLSVPYSLHSDKAGFAKKAGGILFLTSQQLDELENPETGMMIYVTDHQNIAIYDGVGWFFFEPCPPLSEVNAGGNESDVCSPYELSANDPGAGNCAMWEIISPADPGIAYIFYPSPNHPWLHGEPGVEYTLVKSNFNHCDYVSDTVIISFEPLPTTANAGPDQINIDENETFLDANIPVVGTGKWTKISGTGGSFVDDTDPKTKFTGQYHETFELMWTITNDCGQSSSDNVILYFCPQVIEVIAGTDTLGACIPYTLQANEPGIGNTGTWSVIEGTGGTFSSIHDPNAVFSGDIGQTYILRWTISNPCITVSDDVVIGFQSLPGTANTGPDQLNLEGTSTTLQANEPVNGTGLWTIISGQGGSFADSTLNNTEFTGQAGSFYQLEWRISNNCYSEADTVKISFFTCGSTLYDERDGKVYPTVQIDNQCWMAANLNVGIPLGYGQSPLDNDTIEKLCYFYYEPLCSIYGALYQWDEAMAYSLAEGGQGICPDGWHIPTRNEWETLVDYLGGASVAGAKLKETGFDYWDAPNTGATNESNFSARGSGQYTVTFQAIRAESFIWSSQPVSGNARTIWISNTSSGVLILNNNRINFNPVRCIKDE